MVIAKCKCGSIVGYCNSDAEQIALKNFSAAGPCCAKILVQLPHAYQHDLAVHRRYIYGGELAKPADGILTVEYAYKVVWEGADDFLYVCRCGVSRCATV